MCQGDVPGCAYCDAIRVLARGRQPVIVPVVYEGRDVLWLEQFDITGLRTYRAYDNRELATVLIALCMKAYGDFAESTA